jgi:hypothetical protein
MVEQKLTIEVSEFDDIPVDQDDTSNPCAHKMLCDLTSEAADTQYRNARLLQRLEGRERARRNTPEPPDNLLELSAVRAVEPLRDKPPLRRQLRDDGVGLCRWH